MSIASKPTRNTTIVVERKPDRPLIASIDMWLVTTVCSVTRDEGVTCFLEADMMIVGRFSSEAEAEADCARRNAADRKKRAGALSTGMKLKPTTYAVIHVREPF